MLDLLKQLDHLSSVHGAIPILVGESGSGKSSIVQRYATLKGKPMFTILGASMLPEDVAGIPRPVKDGQYIKFIPAEYLVQASEKPMILFWDELDKIREEVLAVLVPLITAREIHGVRLHPETEMVAAMQPVDPELWRRTNTGIALSKRALFLPIMTRTKYLEKMYDLDLSFVDYEHCNHRTKTSIPYSQEVSPRQLEYMIQLYRRARAQRLGEGSTLQLLRSVTNDAELITGFLDAMNKSRPKNAMDVALTRNAVKKIFLRVSKETQGPLQSPVFDLPLAILYRLPKLMFTQDNIDLVIAFMTTLVMRAGIAELMPILQQFDAHAQKLLSSQMGKDFNGLSAEQAQKLVIDFPICLRLALKFRKKYKNDDYERITCQIPTYTAEGRLLYKQKFLDYTRQFNALVEAKFPTVVTAKLGEARVG